MRYLEILFWFCFIIVFYTYLGYGILLYLLVKIKELFIKPEQIKKSETDQFPEVTLFIAAFNEEAIVKEKMENCRELYYPIEKLKIMWVTDGSNDKTNEFLNAYPEVTVQYQQERQGKTAALNRGMKFVSSPIVVFTDANTMINREAIREIVRKFTNPKVGCVAGEKRIVSKEKDAAAGGGEGIYWKYESALKELDSRLYSAVGAAGELFAIRRELFETMEKDTLLDDFILSLRIAQKGYKISYCKEAYAIESASANMQEEEKRKVRIAAGGLQSIWRLRSLLNIFRYGSLSFQYISHRVLRWSITPILLFLMLPLNVLLKIKIQTEGYSLFLILQLMFYAAALWGYYLSTRQIKNKLLFIPYYFLFMNINVVKGFFYLKNKKNSGIWEKAKRSL